MFNAYIFRYLYDIVINFFTTKWIYLFIKQNNPPPALF